jgi:hypothetical protein
MLPKAFLQSGRPKSKPMPLRAGPLTMVFEPDTAFLRHIRLGDHEVVRAIYAAVRDQNWGTVPPQVRILEQQISADSFHLRFEVVCKRDEIDWVWQGTTSGANNGEVRYAFDGIARSDFLRNRLGICILHPILECAGMPCHVEHINGTTEDGAFPSSISPHQPFLEIRGISYEVVNTGIRARLEMEGETFEMEDQRNWTDASFKTYCTPLTLPLPHQVKTGDAVRQSVRLSLSGNVRPILPVNIGRPPQLSISTTPALTLPPIGLCVASHRRPLSAVEIERLKALKFSHLRVELRLEDSDYPERLEQASAESSALGVGLHIALVLHEHADRELPSLLQHIERVKPRVLLWIILHEFENPTSEKTVQHVRPMLQRYAPNILFAAGTPDFFTEINRVRLQPGATSFLCYSNNPQVHAFDNTTLIENLAGQVHNVESARHFTPRPVVVSPVTLRIRNNARAANEQHGALKELPSDVDPRQLSLFGAGWTLASIAKLSSTGFVHSLTYYETTGWRGLMETESGSPLPELFPSEPGIVFPMYHVFADIAEFGAKQIYPTHSSHSLLTEGLTLFDSAGRRRILVANLTGDPLELKIKTGTCTAEVRFVDETTLEAAVHRPEEFRKQSGEVTKSASGKIELRLLPFAVARVDVRG